MWFLLFCASLMIGAAPYLGMNFLGRPLAFMMVYVWGRWVLEREQNEHGCCRQNALLTFGIPQTMRVQATLIQFRRLNLVLMLFHTKGLTCRVDGDKAWHPIGNISQDFSRPFFFLCHTSV